MGRIAAAATAIALILIVAVESPAHPRQVSAASAPDAEAFGGKFVNQLQRVFGRFRNKDLQRVFTMAAPLRCADLLSGSGAWHEVAFSNEYRAFGDWHRSSLEEVKRGFAAYSFHGTCITEHSSVQVTTKFPLDASLTMYRTGKIRAEDVSIKVNPPVTARFESQSGAYAFDLPYLFRISGNEGVLYALNARTPSDQYAAGVTSRWQCKSVADPDVTYQFVICHARLVFRGREKESPGTSAFGTSAFSILSDGREASSSVQLIFH